MNSLDVTQQELLKEIGFYLRDTREQQSRSLEEVAAQTYIPLRLLRAIDAGQADILPEPVFVQGFIRRYADALGLDGIAIARRFLVNTSPVVVEPRSRDHSDAPPVVPLTKKANLSKSLPLKWNYIVPVLLGLVAAGGLVHVLTRSGQRQTPAAVSSQSTTTTAPRASQPQASSSPKTSSVAQFTPAPVASSPTAIASAPPTSSASPTSSEAPDTLSAAENNNSPILVNVNLTDASWLRVVVDGQVAFEGTPEQGFSQVWTAQEELTIRAGNAGAVLVAFNQGEAKPLGGDGQVETVTFSPDSSAPDAPEE